MLSGEKLGAALVVAMKLKNVGPKAVADEFGVKPPSVKDWQEFGRIHKKHLNKLVTYFLDVVPPEHWGADPSFLRVDSLGVNASSDREIPHSLIDPKHTSSFTLLPVVDFQGLDMSQQNDDALTHGQEWISTPGQFSRCAKITKMPDNSMFPEIYPGEYIAFDPSIPADAGDTVLIKDEHGGFWIRKYRPLPGGRFDAIAANDDHAPLRSSEGGLKVMAVLVGHWRGRRARSH